MRYKCTIVSFSIFKCNLILFIFPDEGVNAENVRYLNKPKNSTFVNKLVTIKISREFVIIIMNL